MESLALLSHTHPTFELVRLALFIAFLATLVVFGCDSDITGNAFENEPPETELSVRDTSLIDNLTGADRLSSTVLVSWTGNDPDGFVQAYEIRFFERAFPPQPEEGWTMTTANDSLILLPIEGGNKTANVAFEVRAIDNEGLKDPTPATTIFPIENSPPTIRLSSFDLPPDTTFAVFSFAWRADDPEGEANLQHIDISLNDSVNFFPLPIDADFVTLMAPNLGRDAADPSNVEARVFLGRGFQSTEIFVPGLRLNDTNTFFIRSVDKTDTTSVLDRHEWFVKQSNSDILLVNDWRKSSNPTVVGHHATLLSDYLPADITIDNWKISEPFVTGNTGNAPRSSALPPNAQPTLEQFLSQYSYIYWVTSASTNAIQGNNFPLAASVMDRFFDQGGKLMIHTPITASTTADELSDNPAIAVLPVNEVLALPDTLRRLSLRPDALVRPLNAVPGVNTPLPELMFSQFVIGALPFVADGASSITLYEADYTYLTLGNQSGPWTGPATVASISADQRVGLFALPLVNEQSGIPLLVDSMGDAEAARQAIWLMLESLNFPKR